MSDRKKRPLYEWNAGDVAPGGWRDHQVKIGKRYSGLTLPIPVHIRRGPEDGPVIFVTGAVHGDEVSGAGVVRELILDQDLVLKRGALLMVPVVNLFGFDRHARNMPDRRDLNRCFPGTATGSMASRWARVIFNEIVERADYGIDLHTAAVRRTNFPNLRADLTNPEVCKLAEAFGIKYVINGRGPIGSLRREATRRGCPTIVYEAGEVWKVEHAVVSCAVQGIKNVLAAFDMIDDPPLRAPEPWFIERTKWVRAEEQGFLRFHATTGDLVEAGDLLATNTSLLGEHQSQIRSPLTGAVIGMTTLPAVSPGEPVYHIVAKPGDTDPPLC